jgi:arylsulfatase A-like enzyme
MTEEWTRRQLLSAAAMAKPKKKRPRPNILLILTDQHFIRGMSAAGNHNVRTPNIDSIVRGGTSFANSWCTSPVCSPARASLLTGCLPHTTGVDYLGQRLDPKVPTLGELFRAAGYETAWAGKWHLPTGYPGARFPNTPPTPLPADDRGFDFLSFPVNDKSQEPYGDFTDERIVQAGANFISRSRNRPFLLAVSMHNPHDICYWIPGALPKGHPGPRPEDIAGKNLPPLPPNFQRAADEPEFIAKCRRLNYFTGEEREPVTAKWDETRWRQYLYAYYRMVERSDRNIGILLEELRLRKLDENTMVIFTSDHGEGMGAHQWVMKLMLYQEPLSVPLVFHWKEWIHANRVEKDALASGMDVLPTLCDLVGVPPPKYLHGASLRPVLESTSGKFRDSVFAELAPNIRDKAMRGRAVRTARFKYVSFSSGRNPEMLFDLRADPGETKNLAGSSEHKADLAMLREQAQKWAESDHLPSA